MNKKSKFIFNIVCFVLPLLIIGLWMILGQKPEDAVVEKASVAAMKAIWGPPAGLTILLFDLFLLISFILGFKHEQKVRKPDLSFLIYDFSSIILLYTVIIFCIIKLQTYLTKTDVIPSRFEHTDTSSINLIFVTVIFVSGISTLITKIMNRTKK